MNKRIDIQMLRALAVIFVVLFHLEIAGIESGFLGVDVFFVVSGFLMAILYKQGEAKKFFERRAKRLLPAYFATVIFTLLASLILVLPSELGQVVTQSIYSLFFANNIGFWMQNSYFSKSEFNPLLHLWSLGVEIQFYLIVPLLVWFFKKSKVFLFLALFGSFFACVFMVGISPKTSFFMMPLRMWEFLIGLTVAYYLTNNGIVKYPKLSWLGLIGLVGLFAIPLIHLDGENLNRLQGHPSLYALFVCIATSLILAFGLPKILENNVVSEFFAKIGDYSYSIYLVHFPIIVLYLYEPFSGTKIYPENYMDKVILLVLIVVASILMHKLIEARNFKEIGKVYLVSLFSLVFLTGASRAVPVMYDQQQTNIFNGPEDRSTYRCGKMVRITDPTAISCKINPEDFDKSVLLMGNSHADAIKTVFSSVAAKNQYNTYFFVNNEPMMGDTLPPTAILKEAIDRKVSWIFVHYKSDTLDLPKLHDLVILSQKNNIKVTLILPVPIYENDSYYGGSIPKTLFEGKASKLSYNDYLLINKDVISKAEFLKNNFSNFDYLKTSHFFCSPVCSMGTVDKHPYYSDDDHLTLTGSKLIEPAIIDVFKNS